MIITRWQAPIPPTPEQIKSMLNSEGLEPKEEIIAKGIKNIEKRHPFGEIRFVVSGELLVIVGGTQFLLRTGDKVEIPANTRHTYTSQGPEALTFFSHRPY